MTESEREKAEKDLRSSFSAFDLVQHFALVFSEHRFLISDHFPTCPHHFEFWYFSEVLATFSSGAILMLYVPSSNS